MSSRVSVNFGQILGILRTHAQQMMDQTGILSINGLIVDAVIDYMRTNGITFSPEEKIIINTWCPRVGVTYGRGAVPPTTKPEGK